MLKRTAKHTKYWKERDIDWKTSYFDTWQHPHRGLITWMLKTIPFVSLWEVGVGGGANIRRILEDLPGKQLGGSDVSESAIEFCSKTFQGGQFHVEQGNNLMMSDKSLDVLLSDMTLIYVDPFNIDSYLREFNRVARNYIVLCEFHSDSWWERQKARLGGYHVYNYRKRLERLGYYDIMVQKIPKEYWDADNNSEFRHIITARV